MAFRNPVRTLPASRITGTIGNGQLSPDAVDNMTITGSTLQTRSTGNRVVIDSGTVAGQPIGRIRFFDGVATDLPGSIVAQGPVDGAIRSMVITAPAPEAAPVPAQVIVRYDPENGAPAVDLPDTYTEDLRASGRFTADNYRSGSVIVNTTAANTPASVTVTGIGMQGTGPVRGFATAQTTAPGTGGITGVSVTGANRDGLTVWANRITAGAVGVMWHMIGE